MTNTEQQTLPNGSRIGVYEIQRSEVSSDFSIVYRGLNHHMNTKVYVEEYFPRQYAKRVDAHTVKPLSNESREEFDAGLSSFIEQSQSLLRIEHPNIVTIHNLLEANGTAYLVTGYTKEQSLAKLFINRQTQIAEDELRVIFLPILGALQQVHERGFIHGAATPENILLKKDAEPFLINFANARLALSSRTDALADFLSADYAPPEYGGTSGELGPWTDIYTLGATMYHCVSGHAPNSARDRIAALSRNDPDPFQPLLRTPPADYNEALCATIDSMLALNISDRPQSANAVLRLLVQMPEASPADVTGELGDIPTPPANDEGKNKRLIIGTGVGLAAAALLTLGFWFHEPEVRHPDSSTLEDLSQVEEAEEQGQTALKPESRETGERYEQSADERLALANPEVQTRYPSVENAQSASHETAGALPAQDSTPPKTEQESESAARDTPGSASLDDSVVTNDAERKLPDVALNPQDQALLEKEGIEDQHTAVDIDSDTSAGASMTPIPGTESARANSTGAVVAHSEGEATSAAETGHTSASSDNTDNAGEKHVGDLLSARSAEFTTEKETATQPSVSIEASRTQTADDPAGMSDADHSRIIAEHIAVAEKHLNAERLTTPAEENALVHYRAVLDIAPNHPESRKGLERIVSHYGWLIEKAVNEGRFQHAWIYLTRARSVLPSAPALQDFQTKIENAEAVENSD